MTDKPIDPAAEKDPHADKYNDPRVKITRRGVLLGFGVLLFAIVGAAASIIGRRTRLGETSKFWGDETILALQLGERIELSPLRGRDFPAVDLTGTPGLGHLRRALLDERNFDWTTTEDRAVLSHSAADSEAICVRLEISDPTVHRFETIRLDLDLTDGWVGPADREVSVQFAERKRSGLRHFLVTIMNKEVNRYDLRQE